MKQKVRWLALGLGVLALVVFFSPSHTRTETLAERQFELRIGFGPSPWFQYESSRVMREEVEEPVEEGRAKGTVSGTQVTNRSGWTIDFLAGSWAFGVAGVLLLVLARRLRQPISVPPGV